LVRKTVCVSLQQVAEHGNLVLNSFVVEAKKYNSTVWTSLAIDFFPEVLVI